jgi:hypothetical protein
MTVNRRGRPLTLALVMAAALAGRAAGAAADGPALNLRATAAPAANDGPLTIEVTRWSTDAERALIVTALSAPAPTRASAPPADAAAGRAGRAGRGGARGGAAPPPSPLARLTTAIKAAPTVGYVWAGRITGYSIKYAWRRSAADGGTRVVLVTDRRLGAHSPGWPAPSGGPGDAEFTVLELRLDAHGAGDGKSSLTNSVIVDEPAGTLALDGYAAAPVLLQFGASARPRSLSD